MPVCSAGTIAPGTIAKAAGDAVAEDEVIAQIETDKVTIDVRAPTAGVITELMVSRLRGDCWRQVSGLLACSLCDAPRLRTAGRTLCTASNEPRSQC